MRNDFMFDAQRDPARAMVQIELPPSCSQSLRGLSRGV